MKQRSRRIRTVIAVLLTILTAGAACGSPVEDSSIQQTSSTSRSSSGSDVYEVPDQLRDATMVWSAEPEVDLFSAEGTLTRAAQESIAIGATVGLDYTYRGFAASGNYKGGDSIYSIFQSATGDGPFAGTIHSRIQKVNPSDNGFEALTCVLSIGLDVLENGKYSPSLLTNIAGEELRIRFIRTGDKTTTARESMPSSIQESENLHWQAPTDNRFAGWEIDGFADVEPGTAESGRCVPWARSLYPDVEPIVSREAYARDNPPPVQPAYPGWPDSAS
ncbi:hypothetical protein [Rhodococcus sp. 1168]|uniref:hypothetical protein n=1 Tax=Rhodococcus sp. 1168 TaxID=2018041 RepID=UPI000A0E4EEC|nr:hypothetical protein [Rhodococcus sp. 1168]ORI21115.1 hypothetical protein BJI47_16835 [Rhodococcus sp. 1168]